MITSIVTCASAAAATQAAATSPHANLILTLNVCEAVATIDAFTQRVLKKLSSPTVLEAAMPSNDSRPLSHELLTAAQRCNNVAYKPQKYLACNLRWQHIGNSFSFAHFECWAVAPRQRGTQVGLNCMHRSLVKVMYECSCLLLYCAVCLLNTRLLFIYLFYFLTASGVLFFQLFGYCFSS